MENNNKKYFLKETGEELEFGDIIELTCVKELEDGRVTVEREITFSQNNAEALIHMGLVDSKPSLLDFSEDDEEEDLESYYNKFFNAQKDFTDKLHALNIIMESIKKYFEAK